MKYRRGAISESMIDLSMNTTWQPSYQSTMFHLKTDTGSPQGLAFASRMGILLGSVYHTTYSYTTFRGLSRALVVITYYDTT